MMKLINWTDENIGHKSILYLNTYEDIQFCVDFRSQNGKQISSCKTNTANPEKTIKLTLSSRIHIYGKD